MGGEHLEVHSRGSARDGALRAGVGGRREADGHGRRVRGLDNREGRGQEGEEALVEFDLHFVFRACFRG